MKLWNQSKKPLNGKRRQKMLPREKVQFLQNLQSTLEKKKQKQKFQKQKRSQKSSSKTKSTEEKVSSDPKAPNMATSSSSRLKSVPEKLKNYFTLSKIKSTLAVKKLMVFLFQENPERYNGIEKKGEFFLSIVWWNITMFVTGIASHFCFSITLYQVIRLWFWQYRTNKGLFSRSQYKLWWQKSSIKNKRKR